MTMSVTTIGLVVVLGLAAAGFIVWKFVPDDKRR